MATEHITKLSVRSVTMQTPTGNTSFKNLAENILRGQAPPVNKHQMLYMNYTALNEVLQIENTIIQ
jgi:hypothetical protein